MKNTLVICDPDSRYCKKMDSFLREALSIPFEIVSFTENTKLKEFAHKKNALLVISEKLFNNNVIEGFKNILILDERQGVLSESEAAFGDESNLNIRHTGKYQSSERVADSILSMCLEMPELLPGRLSLTATTQIKLIAFYTPVRGIDQSRAAFDLAVSLSEHGNVLYICNDSLSSISEIRTEEPCENICDLMYYAECDEERFSIYLERIRKKYKKLCYLPSDHSSVRDLCANEYHKLISLLQKAGGFDYIILDFAESFSGLTDVLKICDKIVILSAKDAAAKERIKNFNKELSELEGMNEGRIIYEDASESKGNLYRHIRESRIGVQTDGT
ncbi:hypothetical protein [Butyrivibrio sp. WCD3002]|uniref:hypothetical protein n=1 Tax=Butyrivibrio sp. WCD3002 TaxID=1280676 RepID=UPI0003F6EE55|nr:hypothetical protein [Butyrivibrio sp. WCD3002]